MRIYCPESWQQAPGVDYGAESISLSDILPTRGQRTFAIFPADENLPLDTVVGILWQPPFSAINGWSEQPSDIAHSCLVYAKIIETIWHTRNQNRCELDIVSIEPFLPKLHSLDLGANDQWQLPQVLDTTTIPSTVFLTWDELTWCGVASISGLKYIAAATSAEARMELIVDERDGGLFGLFSAHSDPGGTSCHLGRKKLSGRELEAISQALRSAVPIDDAYGQYLVY